MVSMWYQTMNKLHKPTVVKVPTVITKLILLTKNRDRFFVRQTRQIPSILLDSKGNLGIMDIGSYTFVGDCKSDIVEAIISRRYVCSVLSSYQNGLSS